MPPLLGEFVQISGGAHHTLLGAGTGNAPRCCDAAVDLP